MRVEVAERDEAISRMQAHLAEREAVISALRAQGAETDLALADLSEQLDTLSTEIQSLTANEAETDHAHKSAADASEQKGRALETLRARLAEEDRRVEVLSIQLTDAENQLHSIEKSSAWRLLKKYGKIKFRYLLPIYNLFGAVNKENGKPIPRREGSLIASHTNLGASNGTSPHATMLSWSATGVKLVEVHVFAPDGPLFARTGPNGGSAPVEWLREDAIFFLQDVTGGLPLGLGNTLATVTVKVAGTGEDR
jgi:hypothetical protein